LGVSKPFPWKRATISAGNQLKKLVPPTRAKIQSLRQIHPTYQWTPVLGLGAGGESFFPVALGYFIMKLG
jgi:hypothetical protein